MSGKRARVDLPMLVDEVLSSPGASLGELSRKFGLSRAWLSTVMNSDAFGEMLQARRAEVVDPVVAAKLNDKLLALAEVSAEVVTERVEAGGDAKLALKAIEVATRALGMGAAKSTVNVQQNAYVVALPQRSVDTSEWLQSHAPARPVLTIENDAPAE